MDFEISRGDAKTYLVTVVDAAGGAVDLTGLVGTAITFTARRHPRAPIFVQKTIGAGITITDGPAGKCTVKLEEADTASLGNWEHVFGWDVQVTISGDTSTVVEGTLTVTPDYTF